MSSPRRDLSRERARVLPVDFHGSERRFAGVRVTASWGKINRWIVKDTWAGVEAQYRHVGIGADVGGLSVDFGEHDSGGFTGWILFGFRR
jgi:hypothetical protein